MKAEYNIYHNREIKGFSSKGEKMTYDTWGDLEDFLKMTFQHDFEA